jgi:pimeloyl-ACP methyl ester carboxylesterase
MTTRWTRLLAGALALVTFASARAVAPPAPPAPPAETRAVGTLTLTACGKRGAFCGTLDRPLDAAGVVKGTISVYFEFYPHTGSGPPTGTLVASEGGPGFPTTGSRSSYLALFQPLRGPKDVVLMDYRGTGHSGAIDCPRLQNDPALTLAALGACGRQLGASAPFYSTAYAADDLAAVLDALGAGPVDLYGDSYGTFFAQTFAVRHADHLRTLTLDGAYPIVGEGFAWAPNYAPAMRNKFDRACERSPACRATPGSSIEHIVPALRELRARPFHASATDADGKVQAFTANAGALATVMFGSAPAYATIRETDAAAQAFVAGDRLPLLRLMAEAVSSTDSRDPTHDPKEMSEGLAAAVMCQDAPQIFDMRLPPEQRRLARDRALARRRAEQPDTYAPFTIDEYRGMPLDYTFIEQCVTWPSPDAAHPPGEIVPKDTVFPPLPVLVLSGELDNITPMADAAAAAAQFPHARHVIVANGFHVNALPHARAPCGADIVQTFINDPADDAGAARGARCASEAPPVRLAPPFVRSFRHVASATALAGNHASPRALLIAAAAVATLGDVIARLDANASGHGLGLRGGRFAVTQDAEGRSQARLLHVRWAEDLALSGTLVWEAHAGEAVAHVHARVRGGESVKLTIRWPEGTADAKARIEGRAGGAKLLAETAAP